MEVSVRYAEDHVAEIFAAAYAGEEVQIVWPDKPSVFLSLKEPQPKAKVDSQ